MKWNFKQSILVLVIVLVIIFLFVKFSKNNNGGITEDLIIDDDKTSSNVVEGVIPGEVKKVDEKTNAFIHKQYGFSLDYPSNMKASNFKEGDGEQIIFQGSNGDWFQMYITPWDEEGDITSARIKKDLPDILIKDPQNVIIGPKQKEGVGPHALIFWSYDSGLGDTREVWFVQNGNLYQVTTYKKLDLMLGQILSTLTFQ